MTTCKFSFNDYYGINWDAMYNNHANDDARVGGEWFYDSISEKINN